MAIVCRNPPVPDATCRYQHCHGYYSVNIYFKDPEFKGFVRIHCYARCTVEYHMECWRRFKKERLSQSDKDYLNTTCLTPDCDARVSKIHTYNHLGYTLRELTTPDVGQADAPVVRQPVEKMKKSSFLKIAKKEARKQLRKQRKRERREQAEKEKEAAGAVTATAGQSVEPEAPGPDDIAGAAAAGSSEKVAAAHIYQNLENGLEQPDTAQVEVEKYMTVLNKKEETQDRKAAESKTSSKSRKKKQKSKVTMTLDEFVGPRETEEHQTYMDTMDDISPDSASHFMESPFVRADRESSLKMDVLESIETASVASSSSQSAQSDTKHSSQSQIKENLFSFFAGILSANGPLDKDDVVIKRELEDFPVEAQQVIDSAGGIDKLLLQSVKFAVVENIVCLLEDSTKAKQLAEWHRNPLKRPENVPFTEVSKHSKKMDFPALNDIVTIDTTSRGTRLDELDVFTTTAGNLDSPITSPTGQDSSSQGIWTTNNSAASNNALIYNSPSKRSSATVTLSKSNVSTIVHATESPPLKTTSSTTTTVGENARQMKNEGVAMSKDKVETPVKKNNTPSKSTQPSNMTPKSQPTSSSQTSVATKVSSSKTKPVKATDAVGKMVKETQMAESSKVSDKNKTAKPEDKKAAASAKKETRPASPKNTPEKGKAIKESFKKQVHAMANSKPEGASKESVSKEKPKVEAVKKSIGFDSGLTKSQDQSLPSKINLKMTGSSDPNPDKDQIDTTIKEETYTLSTGPVDNEPILRHELENFDPTLPNAFINSGSSQSEPVVTDRIMRSCDDVSPVNSVKSFHFPNTMDPTARSSASPNPVLSDQAWSHSSVPGLNSDLLDKDVTGIWDAPLVEPKMSDPGLWRSKLQSWKTNSEESFGQLDKLSNDSDFITETRTSDKDPTPTKDAIDSSGVIEGSKPLPKFSKPPGFGGKVYSNPNLDSSATGASKYGPIGSRSRTDSPASVSSKDSSKTSTPVHVNKPDLQDQHLPPFPSVHAGDPLMNGQAVVSLPMGQMSFDNRLFAHNPVWASVPNEQTFAPNISPNPVSMGYPTPEALGVAMQSPFKNTDEQFIREMTDQAYNTLCTNEAFRDNPQLRQRIEADIRADVQRSQGNISNPLALEQTVNRVASEKVTPARPPVKMRNSAVQYAAEDFSVSVACNTDPYEPFKAEYLKSQSDLHITNTRLHELMDKHTQLQNSSNAELKNLRSLVDALEQECKGLRRERSKAVEDREAENKKWQSEKRQVAEEVKNMKKEVKSAKVKEENAVRQAQDREGLVSSLSSQLNVERETIVSERDKFQHEREELHRLHTMQLSRAENAEVNLLQLKMEVGTQILDRSLKDAEMYAGQSQQFIHTIQEQKHTPPQALLAVAEQWKNIVTTIKDIKQKSMTGFDEQIRQIRQGTPLSALHLLPIPRPPPAPENPMVVMNAIMRANPGFAGRGKIPPGAIPTPRLPNVRMPTTGASTVPQGVGPFTGPPPLRMGGPGQPPSQHKSKRSFDRIIDKLTTLFPNRTRSDITKYIQDVRSSRNGSLSGMGLDEIVRRVAEVILKDNGRIGGKPATPSPTPPGMAAGYQATQQRMSPNPDRVASNSGSGVSSVGAGTATNDEIFEEEEDPCIICHDELMAGHNVQLECSHRFHTECIKKWFREQSTCPTCRVHALLPDDFPVLG